MKEFSIHFGEDQMKELRQRIGRTRWPSALNDGNWILGTNSDYLPTLLNYWHDGYDWSHKERELNQYPQFTCELDGLTIHFFHIRGSHKGALPLLLTHGWPDSFLRYAKYSLCFQSTTLWCRRCRALHFQRCRQRVS